VPRYYKGATEEKVRERDSCKGVCEEKTYLVQLRKRVFKILKNKT
jgi:hypothetical protein